jgi:hypothetical protein
MQPACCHSASHRYTYHTHNIHQRCLCNPCRDADNAERGRSATTERRTGGGGIAGAVRGVREARQQYASPLIKRPSILNRNPKSFN